MSDLNLTPKLGIHDEEWFTVMSKLSGRTLDENAGSVISFYVRRNKDAYKEILDHTAKRLGLTPDELFEQLIKTEATLDFLEQEHKKVPVKVRMVTAVRVEPKDISEA